MTFAALITLFFTAVIFAMTPGPGVLAIIATSTRRGAQPGLLLGAGCTMGDLVYLAFALASLGVIAEYLGPVMLAVQIIGGAYLIWLGIHTIRHAAAPLPTDAAPAARTKMLGTGLLISLTNPKVIIFYLSFLPAFVDLEALSWMDAVLVWITMGLGVFAGVAPIAIFADRFRRVVKNPEKLVWMNRFAGGLMIIVGLFVLTRH